MARIVVLDEITANQIAAGEVVERPKSVVKELIENSIDANAKNIYIEIQKGGISMIKIIDDGDGILKEDMPSAFERHATSKIRKPSDLKSITSLGFRGEALASISSVSKVHMVSKEVNEDNAYEIKIEGGVQVAFNKTSAKKGTIITIKDLFFNTPARFKFLKKDTTEAAHIRDVLQRIALAHPEISFTLKSNRQVVFKTPGNNDLKSTIYAIYGKETANSIISASFEFNGYRVSGYIGNYKLYKKNRSLQNIFINSRYIKASIFNIAIDNAYQDILVKGRKPFVCLNIEINPELVDINVHPAKMEARFSNENDIYHAIYNAIRTSIKKEEELIETKSDDSINHYSNTSHSREQSYSKKVIEDYTRLVTKIPSNQEKDLASDDDKKINTFLNTIEEVSDVNLNKKDALVDEPIQNDLFQKSDENNNIEKRKFKTILANASIKGQFFKTYIVLEDKDRLLLIDQHAAHERVLYEQILTDRSRGVYDSQILLTGIDVNLSSEELEIFDDNVEFIEASGYEIEPFGNQTILISAIPNVLKETNPKEAFFNMLEQLKEKNMEVSDQNIALIACKAAVKANHNLSDAEIVNLLDMLSNTNTPMHCPHGRPLLHSVKKRDIEKMFQRIV